MPSILLRKNLPEFGARENVDRATELAFALPDSDAPIGLEFGRWFGLHVSIGSNRVVGTFVRRSFECAGEPRSNRATAARRHG